MTVRIPRDNEKVHFPCDFEKSLFLVIIKMIMKKSISLVIIKSLYPSWLWKSQPVSLVIMKKSLSLVIMKKVLIPRDYDSSYPSWLWKKFLSLVIMTVRIPIYNEKVRFPCDNEKFLSLVIMKSSYPSWIWKSSSVVTMKTSVLHDDEKSVSLLIMKKSLSLVIMKKSVSLVIMKTSTSHDYKKSVSVSLVIVKKSLSLVIMKKKFEFIVNKYMKQVRIRNNYE